MWVYDKSDRFVLGLPARDISDEEWRELPTQLREEARKLGLYEHVKDDDSKSAKKAEPQPQPRSSFRESRPARAEAAQPESRSSISNARAARTARPARAVEPVAERVPVTNVEIKTDAEGKPVIQGGD